MIRCSLWRCRGSSSLAKLRLWRALGGGIQLCPSEDLAVCTYFRVLALITLISAAMIVGIEDLEYYAIRLGDGFERAEDNHSPLVSRLPVTLI